MIPITCNAVGDIIALATLFLDIAHALDEVHGAPAKYRAFNSELKSLHIVLASVARVAELTADPLLRDEIVREVDRCGKDVRQALERVAKFSALGRDGPTDNVLRVRMKRQWYKLEWRFGWHGNVDAIREELSAATQRLTSYLVISNVDGIQNLGVSITKQFNANTAHICMLVMEQFAAVARRDAALSRSNAAALRELQLASGHVPLALPDLRSYAFKGLDGSKAAAAALMCAAMFTSRSNESGPTTFALLLAAFTILMCSITWDGRTMVSDVMYTQRNSITLHDAMGRRLVLPLELCATFELCHATLVNLFSRRSGHWVIDAHRYRIECKGRYGVLDRQNWVSTVRSGTEIFMVVIVQALDVQAGSSDPIYCPVCVAPRELTDYSTTDEACLCSGCGRALRNGYVALKLSENVAHVAHRSIERIVNDRGRFPQHRPTATFGTRRRFPSSTYDIRARTDGREHLFDTGDRSGLLLNATQAQAHGFKRIHVVPPRKTLHNLYFPVDSLEDCCELQIAANNGDYALVAELLDLGEDVNASLPSGYTALHLASSNGHTRVVEMLLDHGATIDAVALNDITPLARAVARRHTRTVALLLARGAIVDATRSMQAVVFRAAARADNLDVVRMLLYLGLDVNIYSGGETTLYPAVFFGTTNVAEELLRNGGDANAPSAYGYTPLSIAASRGDVKVFELLFMYAMAIAQSPPPSASEQIAREHLLHCAITGGSRNIVATVIQHTGIDVNARFRDGSTPLSLALESRCDAVAELLHNKGADAKAAANAPPSKCFIRKKGTWIARHAPAYGNGHVQVVESLHADSHCIKNIEGDCIAHAYHRCAIEG